jgi:membrane protease YdiL (CAAX protease family)
MMMEQKNRQKPRMQWKLYFLLLVLAAAGALGLLPSVPAMFAGLQQNSGMPLPLFMVAAFLQSFFLSAVLAFLGLLLSMKTGLGAPLLGSLVYRKPVATGATIEPLPSQSESGLAGVLGLSALVGAVIGGIVFGIDLLFIRSIEIELAEAVSVPTWWQGLLSSLYGGVNEEIMMRLFCLNVLLWVLALVFRKSPSTAPWMVWIALIAASLLFGLGHFPAARAMMEMSPMVAARILVLNFVPGIVFGVLFWRKGLLAAMTAHFSADVVMHAVLPLLFAALAVG